jgi:hypothetical protein
VRMRHMPARKHTIGIAVVVVIACSLVVAAQQQGPAGQVRTAEQQFKNIKVLKGTPANQLVLSMHLMSGDLGVECNFCHVEVSGSIEGQFDKDDKPTKETARKMLTMVANLNRDSFDGEPVVTCYTCHRGAPEPLAIPILPVKLVDEKPVTGLPSADEVLAKYVQALGGEQSLRKVTSRVITGTRDIPTGPGGVVPVPAQVQIFEKAPNMVVNISRTDKFTISDGFDGTTAWAQNVAGVVADIPNPDQSRAKRSADFYESTDLKKQYGKMEVRGIAKINGRDAYEVVGFPPNDSPERLYFDKQTGLLLRRWSTLPTLEGDTPFQLDYDDYRDTNSHVKVPFVIRMSPASPRVELQTSSTLRVQKVQDNVPVEDAKFAKPASKKPPAAPAP